MNTLDLATFGPVIPVIVINKVEDAVPMAEALLAGGIRVLEVTLRSSCALQAMEQIAKHVPDAILGSGTVSGSFLPTKRPRVDVNRDQRLGGLDDQVAPRRQVAAALEEVADLGLDLRLVEQWRCAPINSRGCWCESKTQHFGQ